MAHRMRKKKVCEINSQMLLEPELSPNDWQDYEEGWRLFNAREFWHAHEAWERVWQRCHEESRIFFQSIIQLAAAYHLLLVKRRYGGMMRNFEKAEEKLRLFPTTFLGVDVHALLDAIEGAREEIERIGEGNLAAFDPAQLPRVIMRR